MDRKTKDDFLEMTKMEVAVILLSSVAAVALIVLVLF